MRPVRGQACQNPQCPDVGRANLGNIIRSGWFKAKTGKRRRYQCKTCGRTMSTNTRTAYARLHCSRAKFDEVAHLRVEGVSISATARIKGRSWNTIASWSERARLLLSDSATRTFVDST